MAAKRALIASYYLPQPDLDSSSRRLHHFVKFLLENGWDVTAAARNPERTDRVGRVLGQLGVPTYAPFGPELHATIKERPFDLALLAFWHIAEPLVNVFRRTSPETALIVDSMDLHFVRHARRIFNPALPDRPAVALDDEYGAEMARELNTYAAADAVLAVSQKEADLIGDLTGDPRLAHAVPDCEDLAPSPVPFEDRRGMLFIGNFEHPPNVDAVAFLLDHVLPRLDPALLAEHPLTIVGNDSYRLLERFDFDSPSVRLVGWVPSVLPYLERSRISVIPLLYGAGTKRKMIQTLMVQTPPVSTTVGIEGLDIADREHVLIADEPEAFAASVTSLLTDAALWGQLADAGRRHIVELRGRGVARGAFLSAVAAALEGGRKSMMLPIADHAAEETKLASPLYRGVVRRLRRLVRRTVPTDATVSVVSRGDPELVELDGRVAWHFPRAQTGGYAGYHPGSSQEAIDHVEAARAAGASYLVLPATAFWWLEEYGRFARYLRSHYELVAHEEETGAIFNLKPAGVPGADTPESAAPERVERAAPLPLPEMEGDAPAISVVIPTHNRAALLRASLESLVSQTLPAEQFEVIVVDDGSTDDTAAVCLEFGSRLPLRRHYIDQSGIAAAKNAGALASRGAVVFFFDDDDLADPDLLTEHVRAHEAHAAEHVAVLGYTGWAPSLSVTEVMHFVTNVGHYLFSYDGLAEQQDLDYTYFWGGRASIKRSFLLREPLFRPEFTFGSEDIELGYRLSKHGLRVVYWPWAKQWMNRPITYEEFCRRCERQGLSQWMFARMHPDEEIQTYCGLADVEERWSAVEPELAEKRARAAEIERELGSGVGGDELRRELWSLYWSTFDASKVKGIVDGMRAHAAVA